MKKLILLGMVLGLLVSGIAFANPKLAFKDIYLGMSESEARKLADKYEQEDNGIRIVLGTDRAKVSSSKVFGVWAIEVEAWNTDAERLKTAVFKKYGKPTRMWATDWKTLFGTDHKGLSAEWHIGKDIVTFEYRPTDLVYGELEWGGFLRIMSSEYLESLKKGEMKL
jgi:hypothetical protein